MCCLRYEQDTYEYEIARTPSVDSTVKTPDGIGIVTESHPLSGMLKVKIGEKDEQTIKIYHRDNVKIVHSAKKVDKE
jgi:cell fate regulator YaaT (PSP1 superfamily)